MTRTGFPFDNDKDRVPHEAAASVPELYDTLVRGFGIKAAGPRLCATQLGIPPLRKGPAKLFDGSTFQAYLRAAACF